MEYGKPYDTRSLNENYSFPAKSGIKPGTHQAAGNLGKSQV
jgi:hypothetical protein